MTLELRAAVLYTLTHLPPSPLRIARGPANSVTSISAPCGSKKNKDFHQLEMRKVLGTKNPADLMTKYLTRSVIDTHLQFIGQQRAKGRAQAGLQVQGKAAAAASGGVAGTDTATAIPKHARASQK